VKDRKKQTLCGLTEHLGLDPATPGHDPLLGRDLGGVTLVRLIAEGGMGRVYEGLQQKPRRPVAVKVMRPGAISAEHRRRFDLELEVLGRLSHPAIAQIFSADVYTLAGASVPYFVMEYIADAVPITAFARQRRLSIKKRLQLFTKVCEAIAHGHERGVVHRDLKPGNILVEPSGLPKVIDFGVARSIAEPVEPMTALTGAGQVLGTVQYMSPEQLSGDSARVGTRSDVYALGLIAYELLAGRPPYDLRRKPIFQAAEIVQRAERALPQQIGQRLHPDVAVVVNACLQLDHQRRYASAVELTQALTACLEGSASATKRAARRNTPRSRSPRAPAAAASSAEELLGCPHCSRIFRPTPTVLGKKIRCRGCRQIFHVPSDTSSVPLAPSTSGSGSPDSDVPIAPACVVSGKVARRCPACDRTFVMQPAFEGKVIRCRGCKSPFRVLAVQERADASSSDADSEGEHPTVFDDIGDILDQLAPGEIVASVVRPPDFGPRKRVVASTPSPQWPNPFRRPFG
jgi:serine/threonine protein kinase